MSIKLLSKSGGFALIFTLTLVLLTILIVAAFYLVAYNELAIAETTVNGARAYYAAEAGIAKKFMDLRSGSTGNLSENFAIGPGMTGYYSVMVNLIQGGTFPVYQLTSAGTYKNATRHISITIRAISYARFAYFSNDEDQMFWWGTRPIWFIGGDTIRGPLHTNDTLNISDNPIFEGPVSSSAPAINYYHGGPPLDNPEFRESISLGVPTIALPSSADIISNLRAQSLQPTGLYLTGNTAINLLSNGTMNVINSDAGWTTPHNTAIPSNGAVFVDGGYVDVSGVLNGQLTIGTSNSIYIVNNLLYNDDPETNPASTDILGLVAQNNVYVDSTAPYDLEIDAYIMALNTSFGVENYNTVLKGTLTIYGGITQYRRGPVGTFNSTTGTRVSGYSKNYFYDSRLENTAPPHFPPARDASGRIIYIKTLYTES